MITVGAEVRTVVRIIEDVLDIAAGTSGIVVKITTDGFTQKPFIIVDFVVWGLVGCFLNEIEPVTPIVKGEWI